MARTRTHTRRHARSNPRGVIDVRSGGFGFVQTAEGEFFIPETKMAGAFDGDLVEIAPLAARPASGAGARDRGQDQEHAKRSGALPAARVLRVIDRAHDTVVGRYEVAEPFGVVVPADPRIRHDIFTMRADRPDIEDGALVRVRITTFPSRNTAATGVIEEVIGRADDEDVAVDLIVARHKLETVFSKGACAEARAAVLDEEGALVEGYRDLRDRFTFTIDPADARDFDDALSLDSVVLPNDGTLDAAASRSTRSRAADEGLRNEVRDALAINPSSGTAETLADLLSRPGYQEKVSSGIRFVRGHDLSTVRWRLGVHIADVSHYVPWNSSIDMDARRRATSVYLVDRVIPMLPEKLSGDLCPLKPGEVRRTMTADLYLDGEGRLVGYELYPALIRSQARLSYDEAQAMLDTAASCDALSRDVEEDSLDGVRRAFTDAAASDVERNSSEIFESADLSESLAWRLRELSRIAKTRAAMREWAGGLDFDTEEARVRLDEDGQPIGIELRRKTDATSLVEEAMILANETVAAHLRDAKFPSLYRVHEQPAADSLAALVPVLQEFSWFAEVNPDALIAGDPHVLQHILAASAGRPEGVLVSSLVLRSMKRAVYRPACEPHFGLASEAYTHFTSPIRRYPDLVVHRMLKAQVTHRGEKFDQEVAALAWIAEHSSDMERVAEKAARESQEFKIIEYLEQFVGQSFSAVVSGVTTYGVYVRLDNTAEGLVPMRSLGNEYFAFDPVLHRLVGQDTGITYRLGQRMPVALVSADPRAGRLDFRPVRND